MTERIRGSLTNDERHALEQLEDDSAKRALRLEQLRERARVARHTYCPHGVTIVERCFTCEPLRLDLFPPRERKR